MLLLLAYACAQSAPTLAPTASVPTAAAPTLAPTAPVAPTFVPTVDPDDDSEPEHEPSPEGGRFGRGGKRGGHGGFDPRAFLMGSVLGAIAVLVFLVSPFLATPVCC